MKAQNFNNDPNKLKKTKNDETGYMVCNMQVMLSIFYVAGFSKIENIYIEICKASVMNLK